MITEYTICVAAALYLLVAFAVFRHMRKQQSRYGGDWFKAMMTGFLWPWHLLWAPIWRFGRWLAEEAENT